MQLSKIISNWFSSKGWTPHSYQLELLEKAIANQSCLLIAPTGGGKTLAGFLPSLCDLIISPQKKLHTLYISPLKVRIYLDFWKNILVQV